MRRFQVSEDIVPIAEFKTQASKLIARVRTTRRPLVITHNGRPAAVVLAPEEFDALAERGRFVAAVERGLRDAEAGRVVTDEAMARELEDEFGG